MNLLKLQDVLIHRPLNVEIYKKSRLVLSNFRGIIDVGCFAPFKS